MKRLNPIYLILLLFTIVLSSYFLQKKQKENLSKNIQELKSTYILSKEYSFYKKAWQDKKVVIKKVNNILKASNIQDKNIQRKELSNALEIKVRKISQKNLERFFQKVLNEKLILEKLDIQKDYIFMKVGFK